MEFVSSIRTLPQDEKRMRTNAAIINVNAACGSKMPLMQEPTKVIVKANPVITNCHSGFCYADGGASTKRQTQAPSPPQMAAFAPSLRASGAAPEPAAQIARVCAIATTRAAMNVSAEAFFG